MRCLLLATLLVSPLAIAQQATSTSGSGSNAQVGVQASPSQAITYNTSANGTSTIRNVPSIFAPSFAPSTPCSSVLSASAGFAGFGFSLGGSHVDKECNSRELVRLMALIGQPDAALALICDNPDVRRTSKQLCDRSDYVSGKPVDYVSSQAPVMPPAAVKPNATPPPPQVISEGTIGFSPDNKRFRYTGGTWQPVEIATQATVLDKGSK